MRFRRLFVCICMKKLLPLSVIALVLVACVGGPTPDIATFDECLMAGYPIMESYPRRCAVPGGPTFVEEIAPVIGDLSSFTGTLLAVESIGTEGSTYFAFQGTGGTERAVLEPEAEFSIDIRAVATGVALEVRGWRDEDGLVHAVKIQVR